MAAASVIATPWKSSTINSRINFFALPAKIKYNIYINLLQLFEPIAVTCTTHGKGGCRHRFALQTSNVSRTLPNCSLRPASKNRSAVLLVNHQMHDEAFSVLLAANVISFRNPYHLRDGINGFLKERVQNLRHVKLSYGYVETLDQCLEPLHGAMRLKTLELRNILASAEAVARRLVPLLHALHGHCNGQRDVVEILQLGSLAEEEFDENRNMRSMPGPRRQIVDANFTARVKAEVRRVWNDPLVRIKDEADSRKC